MFGYLKDDGPRPNQLKARMTSLMRRWLSLASEVIMAMGVMCCCPNTRKYRYSRACRGTRLQPLQRTQQHPLPTSYQGTSLTFCWLHMLN